MKDNHGFGAIKVSIIVPVHNSEKYLRECLTSAMSQTLSDIEILCIDSRGTDLCFEIIAEEQKSDSRIRYIEDPNTSYGHKLNVGIELARGDYIAILESDDQMSIDMLQKLYDVAAKYNVDVVDAGFFQFFNYNGKKLYAACRHADSVTYDCLIKKERGEAIAIVTKGIWTALYRRTFLVEQSIRLNESAGAAYQDMSFLILTHLLASSVYHLAIPLYQYRVDNIGSSVKDDKKVFEIVGEYEFLRKELEKRGILDKEVWKINYTQKYNSYYWNYCRLSEKSRELFLERYLEELRNDIEAGEISRDMFDDGAYNQTFLLLDDLEKFKMVAAETSRHKQMPELCEILDKIENQDIVVFGAGVLGSRVLEILRQNENSVLGLCDNAEKLHGIVIGGLEVRPVAETVKKYPDARYLVVNRKHSEAMKAQLLAEGINEANIEIFG